MDVPHETDLVKKRRVAIRTTRKAFAYNISLPTSGMTNRHRLLVSGHPLSHEAGIQVLAGTIRSGETPPVAALREAQEETGLTRLALIGLLGCQRFRCGTLWS